MVVGLYIVLMMVCYDRCVMMIYDIRVMMTVCYDRCVIRIVCHRFTM